MAAVTPRPVVLLTLAYGAGLLTGLLRFGAVGPVVMVLGAATALCWRAPAALWLAAGLAGRLSAAAAWHRESSSCVLRLPEETIEVAVRLLEPVDRTGGLVEVEPIGAGCEGEVLTRWPDGVEAEAGRTATVQGRWTRRPPGPGRPSGLLLVSGAGSLRGAPAPADRLRSWIVRRAHQLYGARAPVVDALILNRRAAMDPVLRDQYASSGLVHLLSISGFHVGLIVAWVTMLARLVRLSRGSAGLAGALLGTLYVAFLGWPPPATRAALLAILLAVSAIRQRRVQPDPLLAVTCLTVMAADPWSVLSLGAWLSAAALWGAATFSRWSDRALGSGFAWRTLAASVGATLATAPLTAGALGTVALAGIGLNLVAIPLAALAVPGVLASLLASAVWPAAGAALAAGSGLALGALDLCATVGGHLPFGHVTQAAEAASALPWLGALLLTWWSLRDGGTAAVVTRRWATALAAASWVLLAFSFAARSGYGGSGVTLHFLDVGQGDAALVRTPHGHWLAVDAGPASAGDDAGRRVVAPALSRRGARSLDALVVSHAHADHMGGAASVLERYPAGVVLEPGRTVSDSLYLAFLDAVAASGARWATGRDGRTFDLDSVHFALLHPDPAWAEWGDDLNEDSLVLLIRYGRCRALFAGDAGFRAEARLRSHVGAVDLLKVGHHGSRTATSAAWLAELKPGAAVVSVGRNRYGHPAPESLERLREAGVSVWRTDREGDVTVEMDGAGLRVRGRRGEERFACRG